MYCPQNTANNLGGLGVKSEPIEDDYNQNAADAAAAFAASAEEKYIGEIHEHPQHTESMHIGKGSRGDTVYSLRII